MLQKCIISVVVSGCGVLRTDFQGGGGLIFKYFILDDLTPEHNKTS